MSQPLVYSSCNLIPGTFTKFYYQDRMSEGRFVLKVTDLRLVDRFIGIHITPSFELAIYEGNQVDKLSWKLLQRLSSCRFDISVDTDEFKRWSNSLPIVHPQKDSPFIYPLSGSFEDYQDNSSANCEVI